MKTLIHLALCMTFAACSADDHGSNETTTNGSTSSAGLMEGRRTIACHPTEVADAGYQVAGILRAEGESILRLARVSFTGTHPIERDFPVEHRLLKLGDVTKLQVASVDLDLKIDLPDGKIPTDPAVYLSGDLKVLADLQWEPNDLRVACSFTSSEGDADGGR